MHKLVILGLLFTASSLVIALPQHRAASINFIFMGLITDALFDHYIRKESTPRKKINTPKTPATPQTLSLLTASKNAFDFLVKFRNNHPFFCTALCASFAVNFGDLLAWATNNIHSKPPRTPTKFSSPSPFVKIYATKPPLISRSTSNALPPSPLISVVLSPIPENSDYLSTPSPLSPT